MKRTKIHRGELLQEVANSSGRIKKDIAKRAGFSKAAYYIHIKDPDLPLDTLYKYGIGMNYDFSKHIPEMKGLATFIAGDDPITLEEAKLKISKLEAEIMELYKENRSLQLESKQLLKEHNQLLAELAANFKKQKGGKK